MSNTWDDVLHRRHGDKVKPAPSATADQLATESANGIAERVRKEEAERAADIAAACALGDCPDRAASFVADGKSLSDVLAILVRERNRPKGLSASRQTPKG